MHDTSVKWADSEAELTDLDLQDWTCWNEPISDKWIQYAEGPCPGCGANVQGFTTNQAGPIDLIEAEETVVPRLTVKVPVACNCGFDHGQKDASGCGRFWAVTCHVQDQEG
jgi:hypothetical protein